MSGGSDRQPPFIGLTGGLGAGKSTLLEMFERLGCATLSTDTVVHELYTSPELRAVLAGRWGAEIAPGGVVDRAAIAARVFADDDELKWLETLLWPIVGDQVATFRKEATRRDPCPRAVVIETPLLFEAGLQDRYDTTVAVIAPDASRAGWAAGRGHASIAERERRQLSQEEKAARADHLIRNDGSLEELEEKLAELLAAIEGARA